MKKGLLFATICIGAIVVLYAVWPTKMINYLTKPVTSDSETDNSRLSHRTGGSSPLVVRKKVPDIQPVAKAPASSDNALIITKKLPAEITTDRSKADVQPASDLSPVPATIAKADSPTPSSPQPSEAAPEVAMDKSPAEEPAKAEGADQPADRSSSSVAEQRIEEIDNATKTAETEVAPAPKVAETVSQPMLKEKPAVHKVAEKIVPKPYSIMLASCRRLDSAQTVMTQNRRKGLSPYAVRVDLGQKGIWWRVFEGKYQSAGEANSVLKEHKLSDALVKKTPYAILIGAYDKETDATAEVQRLLKLKHSPYFVPAPQNKVRLLVGAFASKDGARHLRDELNARGISNQVVKR